MSEKLNLEKGLSYYIVKCANSYKKESHTIRNYLSEYEKFCKENQIDNISYPFGIDSDINKIIDQYLEILSVAIEYYVKNK
jgi:hypothetical protein